MGALKPEMLKPEGGKRKAEGSAQGWRELAYAATGAAPSLRGGVVGALLGSKTALPPMGL